MQLKDFSKIFFTVLLVHLAVVDVGENQALINFTKPLILLSLIAFYASGTSKRLSFEKKFLAGLVFSLLGDVFLIFTNNGEHFFMMGLGAFLVAQIFYCLAFLGQLKGAKGFVIKNIWLVIPFLAYAGWFVNLLYPHLGDLLVPVAVYALVLMAMVIFALNRKGQVPAQSFVLVFAGALFFVASDSILAYAKFVDAFSHSRVIVMSTYGIAQFLLVWGMLFERQNDQ